MRKLLIVESTVPLKCSIKLAKIRGEKFIITKGINFDYSYLLYIAKEVERKDRKRKRVSQRSYSIDTFGILSTSVSVLPKDTLEVASMPNRLCVSVSEKPPSELNLLTFLINQKHNAYASSLKRTLD
ncbi:hypothetical protein VNO77_22351 [Canavalia gladiata]|uniref:Uncharacterized protein n=1 Tax=Canavalia gladiata TaxID=3824 RepID=A0AAN9QED7_CANGL